MCGTIFFIPFLKTFSLFLRTFKEILSLAGKTSENQANKISLHKTKGALTRAGHHNENQ